MVWDLGKAMRKKEEFESGRLMDFEFRQRARAMRLLARELGIDEVALVREIATDTEAAILQRLAGQTGRAGDELFRQFGQCMAQARKELIVERGDPTPYRLG